MPRIRPTAPFLRLCAKLLLPAIHFEPGPTLTPVSCPVQMSLPAPAFQTHSTLPLQACPTFSGPVRKGHLSFGYCPDRERHLQLERRNPERATGVACTPASE